MDSIPSVNPNMPMDDWHDEWNKWLRTIGLVSYDIGFADGHEPRGYTIGTVSSQKYEDTLHSIVCLDGVPEWDPQTSNAPYKDHDVHSHYLLVPLDPSKVVSND